METRIALIGIILESRESVDELNHLLSEYGEYVIGRMGIPYREKGIHILLELLVVISLQQMHQLMGHDIGETLRSLLC